MQPEPSMGAPLGLAVPEHASRVEGGRPPFISAADADRVKAAVLAAAAITPLLRPISADDLASDLLDALRQIDEATCPSECGRG